MVILMVLSLVQKSFREDFCHDFEDDPINDKLELIKKRFYESKDANKQSKDELSEDENTGEVRKERKQSKRSM